MMRRLLFLTAVTCFVLNSTSAATGLNYSYYEGNWAALPDFSSLPPAKSGTSSNLNLGIRNRDTYFAVLWQGYLVIPADGTYTFELNSDDGSKLYIGNYNNAASALLNNDGVHAAKTVTVSHYLYKGVFPIALSYFQQTGSNTIELYWSSNNGMAKQRVPDNAFLTNYSTTVNSFSGLNYSYVEGTFSSLPDFTNLSKAKTGNSTNIDLGVRKQSTLYGMLWEGYITIPADAVYTFETNSDDGSKVYLGNYNNGLSPLVNNDGLHSVQSRKGTIFLTAGVYPIAVAYYQSTGDQTMELYWSSDKGLARQQIPDNAFKSTTAGIAGSSGNISYQYFEDNFSSLPDLSTLKPKGSGTTTTFDLGVRGRSTHYAMMWQANITVPAAGNYTFETVSDDGSRLYLGNYGSNATPLIDNDGEHGVQSRSASVYLNPGSYTFTVQYFQNSGDQVMEVYWSSTTGIARQRIPDNAFTVYTGTNVGEPNTNTPIAPDLTGSTESGGLTGGTNYYFSSSGGDDARSSLQAQDPKTPWRSLDKLNAIIPTLSAGDAVLLKRGDVFDGSIAIKRTSNQSSAIIISAYGTGSKPVINGFATMGGWVNNGNGIWSSYYNYTGPRINMVTINNRPFAMGRWPNADAPVSGYLTYDSHTFDGSTWTASITDNELNSSVNWTGGELALRKRRWVIDQCPITYQSGNTFFYKSPSYHQGRDGFGYFIQNHPKTLDQFGEWYFDANSKYLQMYFGAYNPSQFDVKESVRDVLLTVLGQGNITIDNLALQGANQQAISIGSSKTVRVSNCNVYATGVNAIEANYTDGLTIENCTVRDSHNAGIYNGPSVNNSLIKNNRVVNTGVFAGMGSNSDNTRQGITVVGDNNIIEYNEVDSTGYNGIKFKGNNIIVRNNLINTFCFVVDDGGGIYTYDGTYAGRKILNNIIVNGLGASDGTDSYLDYSANGIDLDDRTNDVEMTGNSIASCNGRGIGNHNSHELVISNNTVYDCDMGQIEFAHDLLAAGDPVRNVSMNNNIFVSKKTDQALLVFRTKDNDIGQMGSSDNNIFARPINDNAAFSTYIYFNTLSVIPKWYDLAHWKSGFGFDARSGKSPVNIAPYTIGSAGGNITTNGNFDNTIQNTQTPTAYHTTLQYDNRGLDGGALKVTYTGGNDPNNAYQSVQYYEPSLPVRTLLGGHTYRIKFSARAATDNNTDFFCTLISAFGSGRTDAKLFKVNNNRSEIELLFTPAANITAPYLEIYSPITVDCPVYWLDNLAIQEVYSITYTNPNDYLRFEYNGTTGSKTIPLDDVYLDMKNNTYNRAITLAPFTSAVLVRKGAGVTSNAAGILSTNTTARMAVTTDDAVTDGNAAAASAFKLTPNPAIDRIQLNLPPMQNAGSKAMLSIYTASGTAVSSREITVSGQPVTIDVSGLSSGVYTVHITYGSHIISKQFVKL